MGPIKVKLIFSLIVIFFISFFGIFSFFKGDYLKEVRKIKRTNLERLVLLIAPEVSEEEIRHLEKEGIRVTLFSFNGEVLYDTEKQTEENLLYKPETKEGFAVRTEGEEERETTYLYRVEKLPRYYLRLGSVEAQDFLDPYFNKFYQYLFFGIVILILIGLLFIETIFSPIKEIIRFTRSFGEGNYSARINYFSGGDIELISRSLNTMARMIENNQYENHRRQELVETVILNLPIGVSLLDEHGRVEIFNPKMEILLDQKVLSGKMYYEVFFNSKILESIKFAYDHKREIQAKLPVYDMERKAIYDMSCYYIGGKVIMVIRDITEQEKLNRLKEQFISDVTHEFKTPISIIMGYMDILEEKVTEEDRYYFHKIKNSLNRLIEIINDLVKLEKIEYANLFGDFEQVSLEKVSNRAIEILKPLADRKNIELRLKENKPEISIRGIEEILYYCVYNLMENALKYHEPGSGYVKVELQDEKEMIRILICDDGPGIPPQYREDIFRRFYRLSKGRTNSDGSAGSGLGLSIVREGVRFHDGKVICKDNPEGKGTCFEMCFPKLNP